VSTAPVLGWIGERVRRADGVPKTTGEFEYASDLQAAGMLWGHTLRSPHSHARIRNIDIGEALSMPGVHAVLTHHDVPGEKFYGLEFADQPVLAIYRVLYHGEAVAAGVRDAITPSGNVHATPDYQRHIAGVLAMRAIGAADQRAHHAA